MGIKRPSPTLQLIFGKSPLFFNNEKYILYGYDFIGEADNSIESLSFFIKSNDKSLTDHTFEVLPISSEKKQRCD